MDLLGDILESMDKNRMPGLSKADKQLKSKLIKRANYGKRRFIFSMQTQTID
jgi:hypothetical protein